MLFVCDTCGCVDDTDFASPHAVTRLGMHCSECTPLQLPVPPGGVGSSVTKPGVWHGRFPKRPYDPETDNVVNRSTGIGMG